MKPANPTSTVAVASQGVAERLRTLAERPQSLCVRDVIDKFMSVYAGRDSAMAQRLATVAGHLGRLRPQRS
jgi:hypothetical protein